MLEPYDGKLSRTVLRGEEGRKPPALPGPKEGDGTMTKETRTKISNRLKSLEDIPGVTVRTSDEKKTIYVEYKTHRSLDFKFVWSNDHYIGYFTDGEENQSQAVLAIWEPIEAIHFATAYSLLLDLRAGRK